MCILDGIVFKYNKYGSIAYKNRVDSTKTMIMLGGLGDNILSLPYIESLDRYCSSKGFSLIIPQLRSMPDFNIRSVKSDIEDISDLLSTVNGDFVLIGHSTGCNDILLFLKRKIPDNLKCVVLQGPVSDTESISREHANSVLSKIVSSDPKKKYIETEDGNIWLKDRFVSLYSVRGMEDFFSSYLDDSEFRRWRSKIPILSVLSGKDEYCKVDMRDKFKEMGEVCFIPDGNHNLNDDCSIGTFISAVDSFISKQFG